MDDPFGCLQGEKISSKKIQEMLQKKNEISLLSKKIDRCPSCEEQIVYVVNELCLACEKCGRVIELLIMNILKKKFGEKVPLIFQQIIMII